MAGEHYCKECHGTEFYAHQICRMDVVVNGYGDFARDASDDMQSDIYDAETPYGPFTCIKCGAEYDSLDELPVTD